jgi:hypothetical protein
VTRVAALMFARTPAVRAIVAFALGSFTRSRRHIFVLVTYLGIAVALGAVSVVAATVRRTLVLDEPAAYLVALPLVIMFFAVLGVRTAFGIPVDIDASWPFKVCGTRVRDAAAGARGALLALVVYPVAALHAVVALLLGWEGDVAARLALFDVLSGALLVHCVTYGWNTVPFARTYSPAVETLKSRALVILVPLNLFAFRGADAQIAALRSMRATLIYVAAVAVACVVVALFSRQHSTRRGLAYEREAEGSMALLGLSEAS